MNKEITFRNKMISDGKVVDVETGEIIDGREYLKQSSQMIEEERAFRKVVSKENGIVDKKDTHYLNWNNSKNNPTLFTKSYKVLGREVKRNMNSNEKILMFIVMDYIETETNRIVIDGKNPTNKELGEIADVSDRTVSRAISSLKEKRILATKGRNRGRELYVNPLFLFDGKDIKKETLDLFSIEY